MPKYNDPFLESLFQVYTNNPHDLSFKKYFALELYKKGQYKDALPLLKELYHLDNDLNVEKAIKDIENSMPKTETRATIGFTDSTTTNLNEAQPTNKKTPKLLTFLDIAGMEHVKEAIRTDIIYPFQHPEIYKQYNKEAGGGILLYGPPGCGKTYIAKATAGEINAKFVSISIHEVLSQWHGKGEKELHSVFEWARANAPTVIFIDEIDAIGMKRSDSTSVMRPLINQFLSGMDGINSNNENVLIIGATNLPWEVDSALRRSGRFDRIIFVTPPDLKARIRLFEINIDDKPHTQINYTILAEKTKGFSSADIVKACNHAAEAAFKASIKSGQIEKISQELLEESVQSVRSTISEWFATVRNYIEYSNESGLYDDVKDYLNSSHD